jgi:hypothetical protein
MMRKGMKQKEIVPYQTSSSNPAVGCNGQGARDTKRKDGRHPKTRNHGRIAGCWHRIALSIPQSCAWFFVLWPLFFRKHMKENRNVQYSFSRDRLGWTTAQA